MKKIINIGLMAVVAMLSYGCAEDFFDVDVPTLEIWFDDTEKVDLDGVYHAYTNEQIIINISGDMDVLYQYTGEVGSQYLMEDEICTTGGDAMLQVSTTIGSAYSSTQQGCLRLRFSTDFTGIEDSMNINNATWTTIPYGDVGFSEESGTEVWSNWINIFDYMDKPYEQEYVYIAYQYKSTLPGQYSYYIDDRTGETVYYGTTYSPTWTVYDFDFRRTYEDGRYQYYGIYDPVNPDNDTREKFVYAGFVNGIEWLCEGSAVDDYVDPTTGDASTQNIWDMYQAYGKFTPTTSATRNADNLCNDDWIISRRFDLSEVPADDLSVALKGTSVDVPDNTTLYYTTPGEYTISIIAKNLTIKTEEIVVKRLQVKITDPDTVIEN
ncbi:MAG: DUF5017 domain-containing protein [Rikenellaceae bacterium]